jgi:hypothetical protein
LCEISTATRILGLSGHTLALVYYEQGRLDDAAKLEEEVMEKMKRILGEVNQNYSLGHI